MSITPDLIEWLLADQKVNTVDIIKIVVQDRIMSRTTLNVMFLMKTLHCFAGLPVMEKVGCSYEPVLLHWIHPEPREEQLGQFENVTQTMELSEAGELQCQEFKKSSCCRGNVSRMAKYLYKVNSLPYSHFPHFYSGPSPLQCLSIDT